MKTFDETKTARLSTYPVFGKRDVGQTTLNVKWRLYTNEFTTLMRILHRKFRPCKQQKLQQAQQSQISRLMFVSVQVSLL